MKKFILFLLVFASYRVMAQLPETKIYLFQLQRSTKGYVLSAPKVFGKEGAYTNQPNFTMDSKYMFYVSSLDSMNTELYKYDLAKKKSKRITKTREAEYSPKYSPDMQFVSCVKVEKDRTTQHLTYYNLKGKKPQTIWPELKSIGYYEWLTQNEFLSFELPEPFVLVKHSIAHKTADTLATNIGRTFYNLRSKSKIVYLDKSDSTKWIIRTVAKENLQRTRKGTKVENPVLTETLPGEEDYCFMQDGSILMGHQGKLYIKKNPFRFNDSTWDEFADLKSFGINQFYRIAISPDNTLLALVVYSGKKP